jgi:subtilisin family serine protease
VDAWDSVTGSTSVKLGVADFNFPVDHPDLDDNLTAKTSFDDDYSGGWHGMHVSGIVAGQGNNAEGVTGVCWDADLRYYDIAVASGGGSYSAIIAAFVSAAEAGCRAVNFSGGHPGGTSVQNLMRPVVQHCGSLGCVVVTSAGNNTQDAANDSWKGLGSDPTVTNLLVVGSLSPTLWNVDHWEYDLSGFSNYGASVNICAPGDPIISTAESGGAPAYITTGGTSMAAPYVTGAIGLIASVSPGLNAQQLRDIIVNSATETVAGPDGVDMPVLDVDAAIGLAPDTGLPIAVLSADQTNHAAAPATVVFDPRASGPGEGDTVTGWTLDFGDGSAPETGTGLPAATVSHQYTTQGVFQAKLSVTNTSGKTDAQSLIISVGVGDLPVIID